MSSNRKVGKQLLLAGSLLGTIAVYLFLVPRSFLAGDTSRVLLYLVVGWVPYTLAFYMLGKRSEPPDGLPRMKVADVGLAVFLVSFLLSLGFDAWGFSPERVPVGHLPQAVGIFVGLALFGWGIGRRSRAIERLSKNGR